MAHLLLCLCFLTCFAFGHESFVDGKSKVQSSSIPKDHHTKEQKKVLMGAFLSSLTNFNLSKQMVDISFCIWWRYSDPDYKPAQYTEIVNAPDFKKVFSDSIKIGNEYVTFVRYFCQIRNNWNVKNFPFDRQEITISLEDVGYDIDTLQFIPDTINSGFSRRAQLAGWTIEAVKVTSNPHLYASNFGDPRIEQTTFSRFSMILELKREGGRIFFNCFIGFFLASFLCAMSFMVETSNLIARSNLTVASVFVAMGNKYIVDQLLPLTSDFGLSDAIQSSTFLLITMTVLTNVTCNFLHKINRPERALFLNKTFGIFMMIGCTSYLSYQIFRAVNS